MSFIISTDSCCDAFKGDLAQKNVYYIPMAYIIDEVEYRDTYDSEAEYKAFYDKLRAGKMSTTTQLNVTETAEYFEDLLTKGQGDIIHITLSSGLSTTCENAKTAAKEVMEKHKDRNIYIIDSKGATLGQMLLVDAAVQLRETGKGAQEAADYLNGLVERVQHFVTIKNLFHLRRGGRLSSTSALVGSILGIRPLIAVNHMGELVVIGKERGQNKALDALVNRYVNDKAPNATIVYIAHADDLATAQELKAKLAQAGATDIRIGYIGPIIGSHTGPGAVAIMFEGRKRIVKEKK
ncbi:MAG: DegV family protein [Clostridiales bacterium]|nr:DegV family protein [Clostridiales bacterium]